VEPVWLLVTAGVGVSFVFALAVECEESFLSAAV
jgi:hypothetical protein